MKAYATMLVLSLGLAALAAPGSGAYHPSPCVGAEAIHGYHHSGDSPSSKIGKRGPTTLTTAYDSCTTYDGDTDVGVNGGRFPVASTSCNPDDVLHGHAKGVGAMYWAEEFVSGDVVYWAGADGPDALLSAPCTSNGIISSDPETDPYDCGAGRVGVYSHGIWTPAVLGETVCDNGACEGGFDGAVWVFVLTGPYVVRGNVLNSVPVVGHIWS